MPNPFAPDFAALQAQADADALTAIANAQQTSQAHFNAANAQARAQSFWQATPSAPAVKIAVASAAVQNHAANGSTLKNAGK